MRSSRLFEPHVAARNLTSMGVASRACTVVAVHKPNRWRLRTLALTTAWLYALSFPFVWPGDAAGVSPTLSAPSSFAAFVCLVPLLLAVRRLAPLDAYLLSAWAVIPGAAATLYWLVIAMHQFGGIDLIPSIALLVFLCIVAWQVMGATFAASRVLEIHFGWTPVVAVTLCWTGMEWCRAHFYFGGFPWANLAVSQFNNLPVLQLASIGGSYLVILFVAFVNATLFSVASDALDGRRPKWGHMVAAATLIASVFAFGAWRIEYVSEELLTAPRAELALLQGNVAQTLKGADSSHTELILGKYNKLQSRLEGRAVDVVIWPEGAYPATLDLRDGDAASLRLPPANATSAIIGATVRVNADTGALEHNSGVVVGEDGAMLRRFDKVHLVPFGEFVPWPFERIARPLVPGQARTVAGGIARPVEVNLAGGRTALVGGMVCFESLFPPHAEALVRGGAELLVSLANDAWYGVSSAAPQHLAFDVLRAVETGRAVARAANTGISALIDPLGRIVVATEVEREDVLVVSVPLLSNQSPFIIAGDVVGPACAAVFLVAFGYGVAAWLFVALVRSRTSRRRSRVSSGEPQSARSRMPSIDFGVARHVARQSPGSGPRSAGLRREGAVKS